MSLTFAASSSDLLTALDRVSRVVRSNPRSVPTLLCVKFDVENDRLYMSATSSMASVRVQVRDAVIGSHKGTVVVNWEKFKDRVSKSGKKVAVSANGKGMSLQSSDNQRIGIVLEDMREFPDITWDTVEESYGVPKDMFREALESSYSVASSTSLAPSFLQVYIKDQKVYSGSGTSYQILPMKCNPEFESTIPASSIPPIVSFLKSSDEDTVWISQQNTDFVSIICGPDQFQATPLTIPFPDLEQTFYSVRIASKSECTVDRRELIKTISAAQTSADEYGSVLLTTPSNAAGPLKVEASGGHGDWFSSSVECIWTGAGEREIRVVGAELLKYLRTLSVEKVTLMVADDFKGTAAPIYIESGEYSAIINQFRV